MAGTDALPDSWSLGFSEHWEVEKNQRLILVFSVFSQPSAKVPALFSHPLLGRLQQVEWGAPYRSWGLWGRRKMKHPSLVAASNLPRQRFPHLSPGPQPEKQVKPFWIS